MENKKQDNKNTNPEFQKELETKMNEGYSKFFKFEYLKDLAGLMVFLVTSIIVYFDREVLGPLFTIGVLINIWGFVIFIYGNRTVINQHNVSLSPILQSRVYKPINDGFEEVREDIEIKIIPKKEAGGPVESGKY